MHCNFINNVCTSCNFLQRLILHFLFLYVLRHTYTPIQFKLAAELFALYIATHIFLYLNNYLQAPIPSSFPAWINAADKLRNKINFHFPSVNIINSKLHS